MKSRIITDENRGLLCTNWDRKADIELVITEVAAQQMLSYIGWGNLDYLPNKVEQGGWMIGYHVFDQQGNIHHSVVTHIFHAINCIGTPVSLDWPAMEDIRLQRLFFDFKEHMAQTNPAASDALVLIGWFHTHPNMECFLSETDYQNIQRSFYLPYQFSLVLNSQGVIWKCFRGALGQECNAIMFLPFERPVGVTRQKKKKKKHQKRERYLKKKQRKANKRRHKLTKRRR